MDFVSNDIQTDKVVKIRIEAVGGDLDRVASRYPLSFMNEMARQLTVAIESATGISGIADSSVELVMIFAPNTYLEHISGNVTYRRLVLVDAVSAPRDFWIKWTRLEEITGEYSAENILFELGEDVEQNIRQREYKYLLAAGKEKYHNSMGRKKVTEWREVLKRAVKRGELGMVETDYELAPETLELEARIADMLGVKIEHKQPEKEEIDYVEDAPESDEYTRALEKARQMLEGEPEEEEELTLAEVADELIDEMDEDETFELDEEESDEELEIEIEPEEAEAEETLELEIEESEEDEEQDEEPDAEFDIFEDSETEEDEDIFEEDEIEEESELEIEISEETDDGEEFEQLEIESADDEEIAEDETVADETAESVESDIDESEEATIEEAEEIEEIEEVEEAEEVEEIETEETDDEEFVIGEAEEFIIEEIEDDVASEPEMEVEIVEIEEPQMEIEIVEVEETENEAELPEMEVEIYEEHYVQVVEETDEQAVEDSQQGEAYNFEIESPTLADRVAEIREQVETKIRLEYEIRAREKAEEELTKLRQQLQQIHTSSELQMAELKRENERLRTEYDRLLEQIESERFTRESEEARRRLEERQLRSQIETQLRAEADEREKLAERNRQALEEQHRLEIENARIAREREEAEYHEAERLRREEHERELEAIRQAELDRIAREREEAFERVKTAMPEVGDGRPYYTTKVVKLMFRKHVDPNITTHIQQIIKSAVDYYGKDGVYLRIKAAIPDVHTVVLEFVNIPIEEMPLLGNIIKVLGNCGLGITRAIVE